MKHGIMICAVSASLTVVLASFSIAQEKPDRVDYLAEVKPVLKQRCFACHGALKQEAELRMDTAAFMLRGGDSGPAVIRNQSEQSLIIERIVSTDEDERMPPEGEPLTSEQITLLRTWIDEGAATPGDEAPEKDPKLHWAFQLPVRPAIPVISASHEISNPIDAFLSAQREQRGLSAGPRADKSILLRRLYLDLIGLPPTREQLHAFLADESPDAYVQIVDQLLANPQHGERWARHWMDVWRYSDWYGRRMVPDVWNSAPQVWRWRDWIVDSLNEEKGYDRMVVEMLAADELAPLDDQSIVATGYLVRNWYALNYNHWMREIVEHTGKAFLGLTMNCAHCHDHKYDPITQEDYFRMRAFFEPLELRQDRVIGEGDPGPFQKYSYSTLRKIVKIGSIRVVEEYPDKKTYMYRLGDERSRFEDRPPVSPAPPAFLGAGELTIEPIKLPSAAIYPGMKSFIRSEELAQCDSAISAATAALDGATEVQKSECEAQLAAANAARTALIARITADDKKYGDLAQKENAKAKIEELSRLAAAAERNANHLSAKAALAKAKSALAAANLKKDQAAIKKAQQQLTAAKTGLTATEKTLSLTDGKYTPLSPSYPAVSSGRRLAFARWITNKKNPLTARVAINHIWMRHFGQPLVESVFDFGLNGRAPTHPQLLDFLASELMESDWNMKRIHRLIVTSRAYQMRSATGSNNPNLAVDEKNHYLWRFPSRRIEAEVVRDSILYAAGELDMKFGGTEIENKDAAKSNRRSLYFSVYPEDGGNMKFLTMFDAPNPGDCYRRTESIVPQQALAMTNSKLLLDQSRILARRIETDLGGSAVVTDDNYIVAAFESVLSRQPTENEKTVCIEFIKQQEHLFQQSKSAPVKNTETAVGPAKDLKLRARESLVRVLFNHNDFVTIR